MDKKIHEVSGVWTDETHLYLTVDGRSYRIRWADCSPRLLGASDWQRQRFEVSPSGYGIHWPEIDEDLAITPLLIHAQALEISVRERNAALVLAESRENYRTANRKSIEDDQSPA